MPAAEVVSAPPVTMPAAEVVSAPPVTMPAAEVVSAPPVAMPAADALDDGLVAISHTIDMRADAPVIDQGQTIGDDIASAAESLRSAARGLLDAIRDDRQPPQASRVDRSQRSVSIEQHATYHIDGSQSVDDLLRAAEASTARQIRELA